MSEHKLNKYLLIHKRKPNNLKNLRLIVAEYKTLNDIDNVIKFQKAIAKTTNDISEKGVTLNEIGVLYFNLGQFENAIKYFKQVLEIKELYEVVNNVSNCYGSLYQLDQAMDSAQRSLTIQENHVAHNQLAQLLFYDKQYQASIEHYRRSLELSSGPENIATQYNISFPLLAKKDFKNGFKYYENRLIQPEVKGSLVQRLELPGLKIWQPELPCGHLLVVAEQGFGDIVMYFRFILTLADRYPSMQITFFCKAELADVFIHNQENLTIATSLNDLSMFDYKVYLMSLSYVLGIEDISPNTFNYLKVDPTLNRTWQKKLGESKRFKVGIVWKGRLNSVFENKMPVSALKPLAALDIDLICLQPKKELQTDLSQVDFKDNLTVCAINSFADTIAILNNLDLVITVDTVLVHLAGVAEVPTWLLLGKYSDWRWFNDDRSIWYDNVEILRNTERDDWDVAIANVVDRLQQEFAIKSRQSVSSTLLTVPVSIGELFDKFTILKIKQEKITDVEKLVLIERELSFLEPMVKQYHIDPLIVDELRMVNLALWNIEDGIRIKEANQEFDDEFIELARDVYKTNDQRAALKNEISRLLGSDIIEVKDYTDY